MTRLPGKIDVHGLSLHGRAAREDRDQFAIADIAKSMHLHRTSLSLEDAVRVHGETQGHVYLLVERLARSPESPHSAAAVDQLVDSFLNDLPWSHFTDGEPGDVVAALEEAVEQCRSELTAAAPNGDVADDLSLVLAFVHWPELFVARVGRSTCAILHAGDAIELASNGRDTRSVTMERRRLEHGDLLALLNGQVAKEAELERTYLALGYEATAEDWCAELVRGARLEDRTAVIARFLPNSECGARSEELLPRELRASEPHATRAS